MRKSIENQVKVTRKNLTILVGAMHTALLNGSTYDIVESKMKSVLKTWYSYSSLVELLKRYDEYYEKKRDAKKDKDDSFGYFWEK